MTSYNYNNIHSISLKDEFDHAACLAARERIAAVKGVSNVRYLPQGCFGIDVHRIWVDIEPNSGAAGEISRMPEVRNIASGPNFK